MSDQIVISPSMILDAYQAEAPSTDRLTDVAAAYIARGLTKKLNERWSQDSNARGLLAVTDGKYRIRIYNAEGNQLESYANGRVNKQLQDFLNEHNFTLRSY